MAGTWWVSDKDLDEDQAQAVQGIPEGQSVLVMGSAGSGKTNILLLRAKWFRLKNLSNFRIVVFTRTLRDFIRSGCQEYGIPPESVVTCTQMLRELLAEYSVPYTPTDNFETDRTMLAGTTQSLIESKEIGSLYDALLVDECQDYLDTELLILRRLANRFILASDSRQSIYKATHTPELLDKLVGGNVVTLKYHYRSGLKLCKVADAVLRDSSSFAPVQEGCLYDEDAKPSSVSLHKCGSLSAQFETILERLPAQLDAYPGELIRSRYRESVQDTS